MRIYESSVKHPITTVMIFIGVVILGLFSYSKLSIDLLPEIEMNTVIVITTYNGASAEDMETNITRVIENGLSTVSDVKKISSSSKDNLSIVSLEFNWGTNLDVAINDMRDKLELVKRALPDEASTPIIFKISTDMIPIMVLSVKADESIPALYKILDNQVVNPLSRINGVGSIIISGAPEREIRVNVDPQKLEAYHIPLEKIGQVIATENINVPCGVMDLGSGTYPIRVEGKFTDSRQLNDLIVGSMQSKDIYLKDIARVTDTLQERSIESYNDGVRGAMLIVMKQSGANSVKIAKQIREQLPELQENLPSDIEIGVVTDTSDNIIKSINSLSETVLLAFLFVVIVVLFFLGRWRATIIVAVTIPISLIASFIYLMVSGGTLNIISLSSLSIAIGMVVDDAIVVLENITKHIERGSKPRDAAIYATNEVLSAVIASTLTIIAVFFPFTMAGGMAGIMFGQMGWMVTIIMIVSTVAAITLIPMMSAHMLKLETRDTKFFQIVYTPVTRILDSLDKGYEKFLKWAVSHKVVSILISVGLFVGSLFLIFGIGVDFMPQADNGQFAATMEFPVGTRVEYTREFAAKFSNAVRNKYPEMDKISYSLGESEGTKTSNAGMQTTGTHIASFRFRMKDLKDRDRSMFTIIDSIRADLDQYPELARYVITTGNPGMGGGSNLELVISGEDFLQTDSIANSLLREMRNIEGLHDLRLSRDAYKGQYRVRFDRDKLAQNGLSMAAVSQYVRNRINGMTASIYREDGEEYDIVVRYAPQFRTSLQDIENIPIYTPSGKAIRVRDLSYLEEGQAPPTIERQNRQRVVKITGNISGRALDAIMKETKAVVKNTPIPAEIGISFGGSYEDQQDTFSDILTLGLLCLILVYIVMACQFESLRSPFIIMFSLPFGLTGVFIALFITQSTLNLYSLLGCVMLIGIVVKNGIVLVDYINLNRERGRSVITAVVQGGKSRLRPVLMTTFTTILGMLPMALGIGEGSELWQPMGIAIIGGLSFSTLLTLLIIPVIYSLFGASKIKEERKQLRKTVKESTNIA